MKTSRQTASTAMAVVFSALAVSSAPAVQPAAPAPAIPSVPVGTLLAFPTVVQTGTKPTLTWSMVYPSTVGSVVTIRPPGTITVTANNTYVSVQAIGTGVTSGNPSQGAGPFPTEARMSVNGSAYDQLFYGVNTDVEPAFSLYIKKHNKGTTIDFGGRYVVNGAWTPLYTTLSTNSQVVTLVNGATPPTYFPLYQSSTLASYLKPYLDGSGKIKIGPMSVIVLMELGQTNHSTASFDHQDMVLLVTFSTQHPNNGHGNNLDGVDSSNPGKGGGGPNGAVDPSGGVDDERR